MTTFAPTIDRSSHTNASDISLSRSYMPTAKPARLTVVESMRSSIRRFTKPPTTSLIRRTSATTLNYELPFDLRIERLSVLNLKDLQRFIGQILPVRYDSEFYGEALVNATHTALCFRTDGICIGAILARKELVSTNGDFQLYITCLGISAEYRRMGVASSLLMNVIEEARFQRRLQTALRLVLHVHVVNEAAIRLYTKHGFTVVRLVSGYYAHNLRVSEPRDALLLELVV
ncbi:hypothetical protein HDU82_005223 [Entophlyctis luteolus]|nr:hypothetical protein HDU82_005223 [Entophlyctis luteolus]